MSTISTTAFLVLTIIVGVQWVVGMVVLWRNSKFYPVMGRHPPLLILQNAAWLCWFLAVGSPLIQPREPCSVTLLTFGALSLFAVAVVFARRLTLLFRLEIQKNVEDISKHKADLSWYTLNRRWIQNPRLPILLTTVWMVLTVPFIALMLIPKEMHTQPCDDFNLGYGMYLGQNLYLIGTIGAASILGFIMNKKIKAHPKDNFGIGHSLDLTSGQTLLGVICYLVVGAVTQKMSLALTVIFFFVATITTFIHTWLPSIEVWRAQRAMLDVPLQEISMERLASTQTGFETFLRFLSKELSTEHLFFLRDVTAFKELVSKHIREEIAAENANNSRSGSNFELGEKNILGSRAENGGAFASIELSMSGGRKFTTTIKSVMHALKPGTGRAHAASSSMMEVVGASVRPSGQGSPKIAGDKRSNDSISRVGNNNGNDPRNSDEIVLSDGLGSNHGGDKGRPKVSNVLLSEDELVIELTTVTAPVPVDTTTTTTTTITTTTTAASDDATSTSTSTTTTTTTATAETTATTVVSHRSTLAVPGSSPPRPSPRTSLIDTAKALRRKITAARTRGNTTQERPRSRSRGNTGGDSGGGGDAPPPPRNRALTAQQQKLSLQGANASPSAMVGKPSLRPENALDPPRMIAHELIEKYIVEGSIFQVNIASATRKKTEMIFADLPDSDVLIVADLERYHRLFDECYHTVVQLLTQDSYPRFLRSKEFREMDEKKVKAELVQLNQGERAASLESLAHVDIVAERSRFTEVEDDRFGGSRMLNITVNRDDMDLGIGLGSGGGGSGGGSGGSGGSGGNGSNGGKLLATLSSSPLSGHQIYSSNSVISSGDRDKQPGSPGSPGSPASQISSSNSHLTVSGVLIAATTHPSSDRDSAESNNPSNQQRLALNRQLSEIPDRGEESQC